MFDIFEYFFLIFWNVLENFQLISFILEFFLILYNFFEFFPNF